MKLKLSAVTSSGNGSWEKVEELGTLKSQLANTDDLFLSAKNLESDSRVVVFIKEDEDTPPKMVVCSTRLSKIVRKAIESGVKFFDLMKALVNLNMIKNDQGYFLVPEGKQGEVANAGDLMKSAFETLDILIKKGKVTHQDIIG